MNKRLYIFLLLATLLKSPETSADFIECEINELLWMGSVIDQVFQVHVPESGRAGSQLRYVYTQEGASEFESLEGLTLMVGEVKITEYLDRDKPTESKQSTELPFYIFTNVGSDVRGFYLAHGNINVIDIGINTDNKLEIKRLDTWLDNYKTGFCVSK